MSPKFSQPESDILGRAVQEAEEAEKSRSRKEVLIEHKDTLMHINSLKQEFEAKVAAVNARIRDPHFFENEWGSTTYAEIQLLNEIIGWFEELNTVRGELKHELAALAGTVVLDEVQRDPFVQSVLNPGIKAEDYFEWDEKESSGRGKTQKTEYVRRAPDIPYGSLQNLETAEQLREALKRQFAQEAQEKAASEILAKSKAADRARVRASDKQWGNKTMAQSREDYEHIKKARIASARKLLRKAEASEDKKTVAWHRACAKNASAYLAGASSGVGLEWVQGEAMRNIDSVIASPDGSSVFTGYALSLARIAGGLDINTMAVEYRIMIALYISRHLADWAKDAESQIKTAERKTKREEKSRKEREGQEKEAMVGVDRERLVITPEQNSRIFSALVQVLGRPDGEQMIAALRTFVQQETFTHKNTAHGSPLFPLLARIIDDAFKMGEYATYARPAAYIAARLDAWIGHVQRMASIKEPDESAVQDIGEIIGDVPSPDVDGGLAQEPGDAKRQSPEMVASPDDLPDWLRDLRNGSGEEERPEQETPGLAHEPEQAGQTDTGPHNEPGTVFLADESKLETPVDDGSKFLDWLHKQRQEQSAQALPSDTETADIPAFLKRREPVISDMSLPKVAPLAASRPERQTAPDLVRYGLFADKLRRLSSSPFVQGDFIAISAALDAVLRMQDDRVYASALYAIGRSDSQLGAILNLRHNDVKRLFGFKGIFLRFSPDAFPQTREEFVRNCMRAVVTYKKGFDAAAASNPDLQWYAFTPDDVQG